MSTGADDVVVVILPPPIMTAPVAGQEAELGTRLVGGIDAVITGEHDVAGMTIATVLSGGHLLIEGIPGVARRCSPS